MSEPCPLVPNRNYWDGNIPDICRERCEAAWDEARAAQQPHLDTFTLYCDANLDEYSDEGEEGTECGHDIDNGGESLQRIDKHIRSIGTLSVCSMSGTELFSETYEFKCRNS